MKIIVRANTDNELDIKKLQEMMQGDRLVFPADEEQLRIWVINDKGEVQELKGIPASVYSE